MTFSRANDLNFFRELLLSENFFKLIDFRKLVLSYLKVAVMKKQPPVQLRPQRIGDEVATGCVL